MHRSHVSIYTFPGNGEVGCSLKKLSQIKGFHRTFNVLVTKPDDQVRWTSTKINNNTTFNTLSLLNSTRARFVCRSLRYRCVWVCVCMCTRAHMLQSVDRNVWHVRALSAPCDVSHFILLFFFFFN